MTPLLENMIRARLKMGGRRDFGRYSLRDRHVAIILSIDVQLMMIVGEKDKPVQKKIQHCSLPYDMLAVERHKNLQLHTESNWRPVAGSDKSNHQCQWNLPSDGSRMYLDHIVVWDRRHNQLDQESCAFWIANCLIDCLVSVTTLLQVLCEWAAPARSTSRGEEWSLGV